MILVGLLVAVLGVLPLLAQPGLAQEAAKPDAAQQPGDPPEAQEAEEPAAEDAKEPEKEPEAEPAEGFVEVIEVRGFSHSLQESVALKRDAVNTRESIVAEDIGKMPDLNLAEAIQRVPGVAIVREGGEGRQISLRGLDASFTQVTLNGMEVPASTGGLDSSGGINRGRSFDFNVFPSELFARIDINKSVLASIEEGGVAGTVEMYTARPLDNPGFRSAVVVQGGYNDLSDKTDPRITATVSTTNKAETVGFLISAAQMGRNSFQDGFGTVRWSLPERPFRGNETNISNAELLQTWFPRLPRQDSFRHDQDRLGIASVLQFRPNEKLDVGVNFVHSKFEATTTSYNSFGQFRRSGPWGFPAITPLELTLEQDGSGQFAVAGTFRGVALRTESRQAEDTTTFDQLTADFDYEISDNLTLRGMIGRAQSEYEDLLFRANIETLDPNIIFSYDFTDNPDVAAISYDIDVTNPNNFVLQDNELFERNLVDRTNDTARLDLDWFFGVGHSFKFGAIYNSREVDSQQLQQNLAPPDVPLASITDVFNYIDTGGYGSATELDFLVLNFDRAKDAYGFGTFTPVRGPGRATWNVTEETVGGYAEYNFVTLVRDHGLRFNAGLRFVDTQTEATGWLTSSISNTETNGYNNLLPSINLAYDATKDLVLRAGLSRTMTRASLASLAPIKSYSDVNFTVTGGNSQLEPLVSDNVDLGLEWYFTKQAVFGVALFHKDIDSFISSPTSSEPLRPEDRPAVAAVYPTQPALLDPTLIWTYRTSANTEGTKLEGFEIAYQQTFKSLPGFWGNFGFLGNYSYVDAETTVTRNGVDVKVPLEGLSKSSWNGTLYYEVPKWGARVSVNNRDDYVTNNLGANGNISEATTGPVRWDMSAFWHINDAFSLNLEGINLTDEAERLFTTGDGTMNLIREINFSGRQLFLGVRWNY
ncbi:MAG: TonB-dependent receptor [Thermoanaerobaculia bacterium]|nr:TonB-dependent receptor [Thermoanaerobaculia bacterium]